MDDNPGDWPAALTAQIGRAIAAMRESQNMSVSRLAARTAELGYPMHRVAAITKIEAGERAITVPELLVIAAALNAAPLALLMPDPKDDSVEALPGVTVDAGRWLGWLTGITNAKPLMFDRSTTEQFDLLKRLVELDDLLSSQRGNLERVFATPMALSGPVELREQMEDAAQRARALIETLQTQRAEVLKMLQNQQEASDGR